MLDKSAASPEETQSTPQQDEHVSPQMETLYSALEQEAQTLVEASEKKEEAGNEVSLAAIEQLEKDNKNLKDQLLRLAADMENLRKRTMRDIADAKSYAIAQFARDMLSVNDNLTRALEVIPTEAKEKDPVLKAFAEGVEMTERSMLASLERHGVKKIMPKGEKFNPNFHQAMFEIPSDTLPPNTIEQVVQPGYIIGERVLRPALVGVTKAALSKTEAAKAPTASED